MLSKPEYGWAELTIGDWTDRVSYLDDVPHMLLDAMIWSCDEHQPASVRFDAEGYEYIVIFDWCYSYIIDLKSEAQLTEVEVDRDDLARELVADIRENIRDWAQFSVCDYMSENEVVDRSNELSDKCDRLLSLLPSDDYVVVYQKE